jgi:hypothetical protein
MEVIDLIQSADSMQQVLELLRTYVEYMRAAPASMALPQWWLGLPLDSLEGARSHLLGLAAIVNAASRRLDHGRCAAAKEAMSVFAVGVWRCGMLERLRPAAASSARRARPRAC